MIIGGNQPYFIPYIGYWQLMNAVDAYVIADDLQYIDHGWVNRNRILTNKTNETFFNLELEKAPYTNAINERNISNVFNPKKKLSMIQSSYGKAPFAQDGMQLMESILFYPERNLGDFLVHSINCIKDYLEIKTPLYLGSDLGMNPDFHREEIVYQRCRQLNADSWYNAIGGQALYDPEEFKKRGLRLGLLKTGDVRYRQFGKEFIPNLSIIDVIMFNSKDAIFEMLNQYTVIE